MEDTVSSYSHSFAMNNVTFLYLFSFFVKKRNNKKVTVLTHVKKIVIGETGGSLLLAVLTMGLSINDDMA